MVVHTFIPSVQKVWTGSSLRVQDQPGHIARVPDQPGLHSEAGSGEGLGGTYELPSLSSRIDTRVTWLLHKSCKVTCKHKASLLSSSRSGAWSLLVQAKDV